MRTIQGFAFSCLLVGCLAWTQPLDAACQDSTAVNATTEVVSIESLLNEMVDRDSVARFPQKNFRLRQASSYNVASKTPDDPKGWFRNTDNNKQPKAKNFVRTEEVNGKTQWVLMDHEGPGAIVRTWMPWHKPNKGGSDITLRIYLDDSPEPVIEGNMLSLFEGKDLIPYPFAHTSLRSAVNFFPIQYAKRCKVTTSAKPFFHQLTYRDYDAGTPVKTFTMSDFEAAAASGLIKKTGEMLLNPAASGAGKPVGFQEKIDSKQEKSLDLSAGTAAIRELSVKLGSYADPEITRKVVLKMEFDGRETVWCPIGDFFGSGIGLNPVQGWYRTVAEDGTMSCRWVMPYQKDAKVTLVNLSDKSIDAELKVKTGAWSWDDRSMYFNSSWRGQYPVSTRPYSDWNYVTLKGRGVYVADTLTIMNPIKVWWGEGDEKIWVDGEDFPSIFGTGTEDYYAYSWGGVSTDFYQHPFHAQPKSNKYNKLNRKTNEKEADTSGYSVESRSRSLDTMPFGSSLQLDMEIWHWVECEMGYGVGMSWYGFADTTSNRKPDIKEVLNVPPIPKDTSPKRRKAAAAKASSFKGAVEILEKHVTKKPDSIVLKIQNLQRLKQKGIWSQQDQLLFKNAKVGDVVELLIPATSPVTQKLTLHTTKSRNFGMLRFSINGKPAGEAVDHFAESPQPSGPIVLGDFEPVDDAFLLRVEVTGMNSKSKNTFFGIDCLVLGDRQ